MQGILALHGSVVRTEDATQNEQNAGRAIGRGRIGGRRSGRGRFQRDRLGDGRIQGGGSEAGRNEGENPEHNVVRFVALGMKLFNADIIQPAMKYAFASTVSENLLSYNNRERKQITEAMKMSEKTSLPFS